MIPIDFEDAREQMALESIERAMIGALYERKYQERLNIIRTHRAWENHWRTRLYIFLLQQLHKLRPQEPELPDPLWRELR